MSDDFDPSTVWPAGVATDAALRQLDERITLLEDAVGAAEPVGYRSDDGPEPVGYDPGPVDPAPGLNVGSGASTDPDAPVPGDDGPKSKPKPRQQ